MVVPVGLIAHSPIQILAGIEANPSPSKRHWITTCQPDFQTFLRPCYILRLFFSHLQESQIEHIAAQQHIKSIKKRNYGMGN